METNQRTSRIALTIIMIGALLGATLTAAFVASRDAGTELAITPGLARQADDGATTDDAGTGADSDAQQAEDGDGATDTEGASTEGDPGGADAEVEAVETGGAAAPIAVDRCWGGEPYVPSEEELEASRQEVEDQAAIFDAAGISYEVRTDPVGFTWLEWDYENAVVQSVNNSYYRQRYPIEPIPEEELERIRVENAGLMAALDAAGIDYELIVGPDGWEWVEYDWEDPAAQEVADAFYADLYGYEHVPADELLEQLRLENAGLMELFDEAGIEYELVVEADGWEYVEFDWSDPVASDIANLYFEDLYETEPHEPLPPGELDRIREENEGLMAAFDAAGIDYELVVEPDGWEWVEYDWDDPDAQAVADEYYMELYPIEPIPEQELARMQAENEGLMAAFDAAGIDYELVVEPDGWEWVEYDWDDPDAQAVADEYWAEFYEGCEEYYSEDEWQPTQDQVDRANAETQAMAAAFDAAGIAYSVESDEYGFTWLDWDYEDPGAQAVAEEHWNTLERARIERVSAELDVLEAAFVANGIAYTREGGEECETIIFDVGDATALAVVADLMAA